jgi:hypothetical protein
MADRFDAHENYYRHPLWVLLALLGLTSAILCNAPLSLGRWLNIFYIGTVYGLLLGVYFVTCRGIRSAPRLITLVVVSAVAWPIAYFGSFFAAGHIPGGISHHGDAIVPAFPLIALGGALGGVALLIPVNLLLKPSSVNWGAAFVKVLLGILLSTFVGVIAWDLGPTLGAAIWALLPTAPLPQPESYAMAALFFVWQPVIALFIGWATSEKRSPVPIQGGEAQSEVGIPAPQISRGLSDRAFVVILVGLVVLSLTRIIPLRLRLAHREHAFANMRGSRPFAVDLPVAQPMSEEQALILKEIGDYQPGHALKTSVTVSHEKGFESASSVYFRALYTITGVQVPQGPAAPRQYISVVVQQYPNSAWAQYFAEYPANRYNSFDNPKRHALVTQFDNKVRSSQLERPPGQTSIPLYYMWPSGNCVVTVDYRTSDEDLEIVRAYLEKYPSSIP